MQWSETLVSFRYPLGDPTHVSFISSRPSQPEDYFNPGRAHSGRARGGSFAASTRLSPDQPSQETEAPRDARVELFTLTPTGFELTGVTLPAGDYLLVFTNRTGLDPLRGRGGPRDRCVGP